MSARSSVGSIAFVEALRQPESMAPCAAPVAGPSARRAGVRAVIAGELVLVRAEGDARLSSEAGIVAAWSEDSATVTFSDRGAVTTWRVSDGKLLDLVHCRTANSVRTTSLCRRTGA